MSYETSILLSFSMALLLTGAFSSPSAVMVRQDHGFDPNLVDLVRRRLNKQTDRDVFLVSVTKRVFLNHFRILVRGIENPVFLLALYALAICVFTSKILVSPA